MPLFQVSIPITGDQVDSLEELLFEVDDGHWNIFLDQDTQVGTASGVYESEKDAQTTWQVIAPFFEEVLGSLEPRFEELPDKEWKDSYKDHFKPWSFEGLHWVPVWEQETYKVPAGDAVVLLDPGMAFGTGNHETTRLCIEALIDFLKQPGLEETPLEELTCCDAGCGSGILAISAKKLGIGSVFGFDNDPDAVRISHENTELNQLVGELDFIQGDLDSGFQNQSYDLVFANILGVVLMQFPEQLLNSVKPGGRLILSGILKVEVQQVEYVFQKQMENMGQTGSIRLHHLGEWSDVVIDLK
ncbi:MAG: 50S ribosomal protein L11 methyltransferase [Opitutales bacterium]|jgi:ribosomal protein L11 methyltransferase|nr:50S ribosomal protein L11 methyltransferase [Opitutales bacterium]